MTKHNQIKEHLLSGQSITGLTAQPHFKTNKHKKTMTKKTIFIEDVLFPLNGKLITNGDEVSSQIVDAELDVIECTFDGASCVILNTNNLSYVTLTKENISTLQKLILKADKYLEKYYDENKN